MKTIAASILGLTLVVLATASAVAGDIDPPAVLHANSVLSEADALRLTLALRADHGEGH